MYSERNKFDLTGGGYKQYLPYSATYEFTDEQILALKKIREHDGALYIPHLEKWKQEGCPIRCPVRRGPNLYNDDFHEFVATNQYNYTFMCYNYERFDHGLAFPRPSEHELSGNSPLYNDDYAETEADPCAKQREYLCPSTRKGDFCSKRKFSDFVLSAAASFKEEKAKRKADYPESSTTWQRGIQKSAQTLESAERSKRMRGRLTTEKVDLCLSNLQADFSSKKKIPTSLNRIMEKREANQPQSSTTWQRGIPKSASTWESAKCYESTSTGVCFRSRTQWSTTWERGISKSASTWESAKGYESSVSFTNRSQSSTTWRRGRSQSSTAWRRG